MPVALYLPTYNGGAMLYSAGGFVPGAVDQVAPPAPMIAPTPPPPPIAPASSQPAVDVQPTFYRQPAPNLVVPLQGALPELGDTFADTAAATEAPHPLPAPSLGGAPFWAIVAIAVLILFLVR